MSASTPMALRSSLPLVASLAVVALVPLAGGGCSRDQPITQGTAGTVALVPRAACAHAACGDDYYVDAVPGDCAAGGPCSLTLKLVATGEFHINDEYPYRFKADEGEGVAFLGTDPAGKNVFSKPAGDWQKSETKTGVMTVKFSPAAPGTKTVAGTFKLSVCSAANCLLESPRVTSAVAAR